jgi:DNA-binding NarL/FixJ family response regulator
MKIIIADDSAMLRGRVRERLEGINNIEIVGEAATGSEVLKMIEERVPDLIIMDIRMPEMTGIEALGRIKEKRPAIIVCILTNYPSRQYRARCLEEGADYFFDKSSDIQILEETLRNKADESAVAI